MLSRCECTPSTVTGFGTDAYDPSTNVLVPNSPHRVDPKTLNIPRHEDKTPAPIDPSIDKWFYISGASA